MPTDHVRGGLPLRFAYRLHRIVFVIEARANRRMKIHGLRVQGLRVLLWLFYRDRQHLSELIDRTSLEPSALSHILRRLASRRLIARERDEQDNRSVILSLTPAGRALAGQLAPEFVAYDRSLVKGLSETECRTLETLLDRVFDNVLSATDGDGG